MFTDIFKNVKNDIINVLSKPLANVISFSYHCAIVKPTLGQNSKQSVQLIS